MSAQTDTTTTHIVVSFQKGDESKVQSILKWTLYSVTALSGVAFFVDATLLMIHLANQCRL